MLPETKTCSTLSMIRSFSTMFKRSNVCFKKVLFAIIRTCKRMCSHHCPLYVVSNIMKEDCCVSVRKILEQLTNILYCEGHMFSICSRILQSYEFLHSIVWI